MKIGDIEVPDSAVEDFIKKSGKRIVDDDDYQKKASAAADLAKFRKVTGEDRSIEEIDKIIKEHSENERKQKTQAELALAEAKRLEKLVKETEAKASALEFEIRKRDVTSYFEKVMAETGVKVIDPILEPERQKFYSIDPSSVTPEQLKEQVTQALLKAQTLQVGELAKLGFQGISPDQAQGFSVGGGITPKVPGVSQTPFTSETDMWAIMQKGAASPLGIPGIAGAIAPAPPKK